MGIHAKIEIINNEDLAIARRGLINYDEIKIMFVDALVSAGVLTLTINEFIREQLQLDVVEKRKVKLADGSIKECDVVSPVEIKFKNRRCCCSPIVLPGNARPLLGTMLIGEMDVLIHPLRQELIVNPEHPDYAQLSLKVAV